MILQAEETRVFETNEWFSIQGTGVEVTVTDAAWADSVPSEIQCDPDTMDDPVPRCNALSEEFADGIYVFTMFQVRNRESDQISISDSALWFRDEDGDPEFRDEPVYSPGGRGGVNSYLQSHESVGGPSLEGEYVQYGGTIEPGETKQFVYGADVPVGNHVYFVLDSGELSGGSEIEYRVWLHDREYPGSTWEEDESDSGSVTGGRDEQTRTPTETDEEDESTPTTERVDLRDASVVADVTIEGQEYLVLDDLPNGASGEYAYTTADYKLLEPTRATDVAVSYEYCEGYIAGGEDRLEYTNEQHAELDEIERWARTANILALLGGAVALAKINPVGSLTKVAELASQTLDWAQQDINEPYKEQYLKIAAQSSTLDWIDEEAPEPGDSLSAFDLVDGGTDLVQLSLETYEAVDSMGDLVQASSTVSSVLSRADSIRTDVDPSNVSGISDLRHTGYTVLTSLAVNATVSSIANVAEVQAKSAALGGGSAGARRPILNELVTLEERVRECNIGPSGILQIQALKQVDYQMEAAAWAGIADLYEGLSDSRLGLGYDAVLETDEFAQTARQNAESWEELSHYVMAGTGQYLDQGRERYSESFNNDQYGEQPVLGNS